MHKSEHKGSSQNGKTTPNHQMRRNSERSRRSAGFAVIALAASAGGLQALSQILSTLPADFPVPLAVIQHRTTKSPNLLARVLARQTRLKVKTATDGEQMHPGTVYIAPPDQHLLINTDHTLALSDGRRIRHVLSSANPPFTSAAHTFKNRVIAVVLTGGDSDATDGVQSVKAAGGIVIVQDQATSEHFAMPKAAIETSCGDYVLPLNQSGPTLLRFVRAGH